MSWIRDMLLHNSYAITHAHLLKAQVGAFARHWETGKWRLVDNSTVQDLYYDGPAGVPSAGVLLAAAAVPGGELPGLVGEAEPLGDGEGGRLDMAQLEQLNNCCDLSWSHLGHLALGAEEGVALELPRPRLGLRDEGEHVVPGRVRHAVRDPGDIYHIVKHSLSIVSVSPTCGSESPC